MTNTSIQFPLRPLTAILSGVCFSFGLHYLTPLLPEAAKEFTNWIPDTWDEVLPAAFLPDQNRETAHFEDLNEEAILFATSPVGTAPDEAAINPSLPQSEEPVELSGSPALPPLNLKQTPDSLEGLEVKSKFSLPPPPTPYQNSAGLTIYPIEDPQGTLTRFYRALQRSEAALKRGEPDRDSITRIIHYGDSLLTGDYVTDQVRRLLQRRFGDAGHGFVLAGKPAPWYHRAHLQIQSSTGWEIYRLTSHNIKDGWYGIGGATFLTRNRGQYLKIKPTGQDLGQSVTRMQVFYASQPDGGKFELQVDQRTIEIDTKAPVKASRLAEIQVADGSHHLQVKTLGGGEVRLFGVSLEREGPGVIYDTMGMDGARARHLKNMNPEHWHDQLRLREPDLLVLHYGTNESQMDLNPEKYAAELAQTVGHLRAALPGISCLLISPLDRAYSDHGKLKTRPIVPKIVAAQRQIAYQQGCAFWNAFEAMGGEGSMVKWYRAGLGGGDLTHPTRKGADRVGALYFGALMDGYGKFEQKEK